MTPPMATQEPEKKRRRNPQVFADPCPHCGSKNTRVRRTYAIIRRVYCLDCNGPGWKQTPKRD